MAFLPLTSQADLEASCFWAALISDPTAPGTLVSVFWVSNKEKSACDFSFCDMEGISHWRVSPLLSSDLKR